MAYCSKCGRGIPGGAVFCPNCGASASQGTQATSQTGPPSEFDRLTRDRGVQEHWFSRVIVFIIDSAIFWIAFAIIAVIYWLAVGIPGILLGAIPFNPFGFAAIGWLGNVLFVLYFAIAEAWYGRTIGKSVMRLHVVTTEGSAADFGKTFVRDLSKIYWPLLILDIIGGLFTKTQHGQKFSDHFIGTLVAKY